MNRTLHPSSEEPLARRDKVAVFLPALLGGGAERSILNLAQGFAAAGYDVDLILAQAVGPYLGDVGETVRLVDLKAPRALACVPGLVRYLRSERPVALISALNFANVLALWARRLAGVPTRVLVNEQNTISRSARNSVQWRQRMVPYLVRLFYPWADYVIGNSQGVASDLRQVTGLPAQRVHILHNPVVTPAVRSKAQAALNHPWFEPGQPPVILAVGRLTKQKDFPNLIEAFARLVQTSPARLLILGEGRERAALEALVHKLGLVDLVLMPGFVENPYAYMRRAALYVLSSQWEGLPTVLIEALYCGAPVIATDCPSGSREILADGRYGMLVPVGDAQALSRAMEASLQGRTPRPTEESWRPYTLEAIVDQYAALLLNGRSRSHGVPSQMEAPHGA